VKILLEQPLADFGAALENRRHFEVECPLAGIGRTFGPLAFFARAPVVERHQSFESVHDNVVARRVKTNPYVLMRLAEIRG